MTKRKLISIAVLLAVVLATLAGSAGASSHREAPLISLDPAADNTDLYAFVSPDKPDSVTIVANYIPLEEPAGGPNFASFNDDVLYAIHVDNDGDGHEDITYQFRFKTSVQNPDTFLYNTGPIASLDDPNWNVRQTYSVTRIKDHKSKLLGSDIPTPPVNIGPRSTPSYASLAAAVVTDLSGGIKVFAGQRDDPFFVDLGSIFDLGGLRPFNALHIIPLDSAPGVDGVGGFNTHSIAIQVPIKQLTGPHGQTTIGVYASASRRKISVLRGDGTVATRGSWVQVSRLGEPLINEVIIPLGHKDFWNASDPANDRQFEQYYLNPELTRLENFLYPALDNANETNRADLVAILLTGVPGLNFTGDRKADLLRLNMAVKPGGDQCLPTPSRLGVLDGDFCGFPNGRRLADDVVDIELRATAEGYGPILHTALGLPDRSPNDLIGDGVDANDMPFLSTFPYVATPHQGYEHVHHPIGPALQQE